VDEFIKIAQAIALLSASALCLYLIVVLVQLKSVLESLQRDLSDLSRSLKPVLENLVVITSKIKDISARVNEQVEMFHGMFSSVQRIVENVVRFEEHVQQRLEEPFLRVASLFGGLVGRLMSLIGLSSERAH
jgi:uncharacterized protein YoxC